MSTIFQQIQHAVPQKNRAIASRTHFSSILTHHERCPPFRWNYWCMVQFLICSAKRFVTLTEVELIGEVEWARHDNAAHSHYTIPNTT